MNIPKTFKCRTCTHTLPIDNFYAMPRSRRGHHTQCKSCTKAYNDRNAAKNVARTRKWYDEHIEWVRQQSAEWREKNREEHNKKSMEYYYANRDQCLATRKRYYNENKEQINANAVEYYNEHKEHINQQAIDRYHERMKNDPDYAEFRRKQQREYQAANHDEIREKARAKYAEQKKDPEFREKKRAEGRRQYAQKKARLAAMENTNDRTD